MKVTIIVPNVLSFLTDGNDGSDVVVVTKTAIATAVIRMTRTMRVMKMTRKMTMVKATATKTNISVT